MELQEIIQRLADLRKPCVPKMVPDMLPRVHPPDCDGGCKGTGEEPKYPGLLEPWAPYEPVAPELAAMRVLETLMQNFYWVNIRRSFIEIYPRARSDKAITHDTRTCEGLPGAILRAVAKMEGLEKEVP